MASYPKWRETVCLLLPIVNRWIVLVSCKSIKEVDLLSNEVMTNCRQIQPTHGLKPIVILIYFCPSLREIISYYKQAQLKASEHTLSHALLLSTKRKSVPRRIAPFSSWLRVDAWIWSIPLALLISFLGDIESVPYMNCAGRRRPLHTPKQAISVHAPRQSVLCLGSGDHQTSYSGWKQTSPLPQRNQQIWLCL